MNGCIKLPQDYKKIKNTTISSNIYQYNGCFYDVPEAFEFPKIILRDAMLFWYIGQAVSKDCAKVVIFFRIFILFLRG